MAELTIPEWRQTMMDTAKIVVNVNLTGIDINFQSDDSSVAEKINKLLGFHRVHFPVLNLEKPVDFKAHYQSAILFGEDKNERIPVNNFNIAKLIEKDLTSDQIQITAMSTHTGVCINLISDVPSKMKELDQLLGFNSQQLTFPITTNTETSFNDYSPKTSLYGHKSERTIFVRL